MSTAASRVTVHMVASVDGFIARRDGGIDWMEVSDHYANGVAMQPDAVAAVLASIDCYVMGARTYEAALEFEARGFGWAYGDTPTIVLTHRDLPRTRHSVQFLSGELSQLFAESLRPHFPSIWVVGGGTLAAECLRLGLADEVCYAMLPIVIGDGIRFFERLDRDVALHLADVKAYDTGMVELRYEVQRVDHIAHNP